MEFDYDEDAAIPFEPDIGPYAAELDRLGDRIHNWPEEQENILRSQISDVEAELQEDDPDKDRLRYLASLHVLLDLVEIGYRVEKTDDLRVYAPDPDSYRDDPTTYKEVERQVLQKERYAQLKEESVRDFIEEMETPGQGQRNKGTIKQLLVDGPDLYDDLAPLADQGREEIVSELDTMVDPYIQVVEDRNRDQYTGRKLRNIWRYLRYTWLTPYNTVPGRNINFLIRDGARRNDPIMGIAALGSSMMNLSVRDKEIGWSFEGLKQRLDRKHIKHKSEELLPADERTPERKTRVETHKEWLETEEEFEQRKQEVCEKYREAIQGSIAESIENIRIDDLIEHSETLTETHFENAESPVFEELQRFEGLARYVIQGKPPLAGTGVDVADSNDQEPFDLEEWGLRESDLDRIWFEDDDPNELETWQEQSETALFVRKRAETLQRLLRDRAFLQEHAEKHDDATTFIEEALSTSAGKRAIKTGLKEVKKRRVGAGMMNIMVCGAIPPYNHILGGKLVAMALTGPKVINIYRDKYEDYESKIASSMKGEAVIKPNELVLLDTTGLFAVGCAQYDRVRVPTDEGQIEFTELGTTAGYGSVQFGRETRKYLAAVTEREEGRKVVRGRFGEGVAPRMRKIRRGLVNCGLDGELLKHESPRVVYTVDLATDNQEYLLGLTDNPNYVWDLDEPERGQQEIYDHWKERWVSKRVQRADVLESIQTFDYRDDLLLGHELDFGQGQWHMSEYT